MKARLQDNKLVIELRKRGFSYKEIQENIPVSKGLISRWLTNISFSPEEDELLRLHRIDRLEQGRLQSISVNRKKRIDREIKAFEDAKTIFAQYHKDHSFIIGVVLYWAEGAKSGGGLQFVNSDPAMINFMYKWIQKYLKISKDRIECRLFTRRTARHEDYLSYWAGMLSIDRSLLKKTIIKPRRHVVKNDSNYKGSIRLSVTNVYVLRLMKAWQKLVMQYYGEMRP